MNRDAETVPSHHEAPSTLLDTIKAMNGAIDMFVAARVAVESAARDLEALRVSRLDHLDLDWSEPDHIWLNGFACICPTDEFAAQVGRNVIRAANFSGCDLRGANITGLDFSVAKTDGARFDD